MILVIYLVEIAVFLALMFTGVAIDSATLIVSGASFQALSIIVLRPAALRWVNRRDDRRREARRGAR